MKVKDLTKEQLAAELKKTIKVRAVGEPDIFIGYYNHVRRRGGDIFILRPMVRERSIKAEDPITKRIISTRKTEQILITAEQQFSQRWMEKINTNAPETTPAHFNQVGRGRARLNIPGMTSKVGGDDAAALSQHDRGGNFESIETEDTATLKALEDSQKAGSEPSVL